MASAIGSDLPGQPPPYNVDDDVALLQPGDDEPEPVDHKSRSQPNSQPQPYGYTPQPQPGYYGQPVASAPSYIPQAEHYRQQTTIVVTGRVQQQPVYPQVESYGGRMLFACLVLWCCNPLLGLIAFILAAHADSIKDDDREGAYRYGRASLWISVAGVIVGIIVSAVLIAVVVTNGKNQNPH